jgi:hypothetical protein
MLASVGGGTRGRASVEILQPDSSANQKFSISDACKKSYFPLEVLFVATQYEIPFKLSMSTFQVSIIAMTPAIASHKVRHPSWNFWIFIVKVLRSKLVAAERTPRLKRKLSNTDR